MTDAEKTVFISYRISSSKMLAAYIDQFLRSQGYDVFRDVNSIDAGDFERVILNQIAARVHFIAILAPGTLERCSEPNDWVRREIEHAMDLGRNIVPILAEGFNFNSNEANTHLTGKLTNLRRYNALDVPYNFLDEAMERLRTRFLKPPAHPVQIQAVPQADRLVAAREQARAELQPPPTEQELTAEEYFNRGAARDDNSIEELNDYTEAIRLKPDYAAAYNNRGAVRREQGDLDGALADYTEALQLDPQYAKAYYNRGNARQNQGDLAGALADYTEALRLDPKYVDAYINRGNARKAQGDLAGALADYTEALQLDPQYAKAYYNRGVVREDQGDLAGALADYTEALRLDPKYVLAYYNRGILRKQQNDFSSAIADYQKYLDLGGGQQWNDQAEIEQIIADLKRKLNR